MEQTYDPVLDNLSPKLKREYWDASFGLQAVDDIKPSKYMESLAEAHIAGKKSYHELSQEVDAHYETSSISAEKEADEVSKSIYEILANESFRFDVPTFKSYHRRLFKNLDPNIFHPGEFRTINIIKKEEILSGDTVQYQDYGMLEETLTYDFEEERSQDYLKMTEEEKITRFATFTSRIWQVHPFYEGNTRTTAIFIQKYLRNLGYKVDNELFKDHSKDFRNYTNIEKGYKSDLTKLVEFFQKLLFDK